MPENSLNLIKKVLGENYITLRVSSLSLYDDMDNNCIAKVKLKSGENFKGTGVGQVNAIFNAFKSHYKKKYQSLESIYLTRFEVYTSKKRKILSEDKNSSCRVCIEVKSYNGRYFNFEDTSNSLSASTTLTAAAVAEFFINSERAYVFIFRALQDALERNRQDLVSRFEKELSTLVQNISYAKIIESLKP